MGFWKIPEGVTEKRAKAGEIDFRYLEAGPAGGGNGTLLLLHGFGARSEIWLRAMRDLSREWRVIAPDLPCHGESSQLPGKARTLPLYLTALQGFADTVLPSRYFVVGSSMGGALGTMLAASRPDKVGRLVLLDAAGLTEKLPSKTVRLYFPYILPAYLFAPGEGRFRSFLAKGVFHDPKFIDDLCVQAAASEWHGRKRRMSFIATANALRRPDGSVVGDLSRIKCPTLVIWGKQDAHFDWHDGEKASKSIAGASFAGLDGCGHLPMVEKYPETLELLNRFLA